MKNCVLALDVGGTDMKGAIIEEDGQVAFRLRRPTNAAGGTDSVLQSILGCLAELRELTPEGLTPQAAGVAVTGIVDEQNGLAVHSENVGWRNMALRSILEDATGIPVGFGHDVRAGGLAEHRLGAGRGFSDMVFVAIGTGLSAAVIVHGELVYGSGYAGEIGHVATGTGRACPCGGVGCAETSGSASAIARNYTELTGVEVAGAKEVAERLATGDVAARQVWDEAVEALAEAMAWTTGAIAPQAFVVGGGLARAQSLLFGPLGSALDARLTVLRRPQLIAAQLGDQAGCIGAGLLGWEALAERSMKAAWGDTR